MNKIEEIIQSIEHSKATNNYFACLTSSLILIDICSSIEYNGQHKLSWDRYQSWINNHLLVKEIPENTDYLDAINIWHLRCALLHEGATNPNTQKKSYAKNAKRKVKDIIPVSNLIFPEKIMVVDVSDDQIVIFFDVGYFVDIVLHSTKEWISSNLSKIQKSESKIFSIAQVVDYNGKMMVVRKLNSENSD